MTRLRKRARGRRLAVEPLDRVGHVICRAFNGGRCGCAARGEHVCEAARTAAQSAVRFVDGLREAGIEVVS